MADDPSHNSSFLFQSTGNLSVSQSKSIFKFKRHNTPKSSLESQLQAHVTSNSDTTGANSPREDALTGSLVLHENLVPAATDLDPIQCTRHADSQRSRLILGSRFSSPQVESNPETENIPIRTKANTMDISTAASAARTPSLSFADPHSVHSRQISGARRVSLQDKLGKSIYQRIDGENERSTDSPPFHLLHQRQQNHANHSPLFMAPEMAGQNPSQSIFRNEPVPPAHSRSASVVSSIFGRHDEDISSIMMRGATDLRNTKFEVEEQRREISFLQVQLEALRNEKDEAMERLKAVKETAKRSLESSSKSLHDLESTLNDLKTQSQESFQVLAQARNSLPDVRELRETISGAMKSIEPLMDESGHFERASETKIIINNLELECNKSEQVADLLRDRLQSVGSELIDAKSRIAELEGAQAADREALRASSSTLSSTGEQVTELADRLKQQQHELYQVLSTAAEAQAKLEASNERIQRLDELVGRKDAELEELHGIQQEKVKLACLLDDQTARVSSLESVRDELAEAYTTLRNREEIIQTLKMSSEVKEGKITDLEARFSQVQTRLEEESVTMRKLQESLKICEMREQTALKENERYSSVNGSLEEKLRSLGCQLQEVRKESEFRQEKLHQADSRCQILEERFDDQVATLRASRQSNGDMQDRLVAAEATYARDLESTTGKLNCEIAVLKEQNSYLQAQAANVEAAMKRQEEAAVALKTDYESKLKHQEDMYTAKFEAEERRAHRAECDLEVSRSLTESLREKLAATSAQAQDLREQLQELKSTLTVHKEETDASKSQIKTLEGEKHSSSERAKTIDSRYRKGDLIDEEKAFINTLIQTSQAIHEKELVAKGNELRRRDNTIKDLRSKIHLLESTLAKHLHSQAKAKNPAGAENRSMINPASWVSSDLSSSPPASGPQAPDRDAPSTNVDPVVSAKPTPTPFRPAHSMAPPALLRTTQTIIAKLTPAAAPKTPSAAPALLSTVPQSAGPNKPIFSRLARNSSDEIVDFEENTSQQLNETVTLGKRDKTSSPLKSPENQSARRPSKRLVGCSCRSLAELNSTEGNAESSNAQAKRAADRGKYN
ncbi:hypothetical protein AcV5_001238 [Taiwanofungus camphoratus]|nr:hypothetical protein AcV5_001238 [Antrodia cinnamomea]